MTKSFKWLLAGDLQLPYQDDRAVALLFKVIKAWKPDAIDLVGDIADFLEFSSFSDGTTDEFFAQLKKQDDPNPLAFIQESCRVSREFFEQVRATAPDADIHFASGNHESRLWKYIDKKAPQYNDMITPDDVWGLDNLGIDFTAYEDKPVERFGGIYVHHGVTTTTTGLAVKADIESYGVSLIRGHDHRGGVVFKTYPMLDKTLVGMGTGHLCDPTKYGLRYTINPSWEQGFGIVHLVDDAPFVQFIQISRDYTCVVDGRVYAG